MAIHALKARYVFPVSSEPIPDGMVSLDGERIAAVGRQVSADTVADLGNAAILPGLINAHAHLEFSNLAKPLGEPGMGFANWIRRVIEYRWQTIGNELDAVQDGFRQCASCGVTTVGQIAQADWLESAIVVDTADGTALLELIAPTADRVAAALELAQKYISIGCAKHTTNYWQIGLSPHAPYSVHLDLLKKVIALSAKMQLPLAMHLAESREEMQWLAEGRGPLKELLIELGAFDSTTVPVGFRPLDYLRMLGNASRVLVIHGNYLGDDEIVFLADHVESMAVVFCPRTHEYFGHDCYPLERMLAAGVTVCLGTDSRASSPDLDLLSEIRWVARNYPEIPPPTVLKLGTLQGAWALGRDQEIGNLEKGKYANLAVVPLPDRDTADPHELLFDSDKPAKQTWFRGRRISG